ncbi:histidinol-phosphatase HisJ family protein [Candidatus Babeliales bacterium]|nr:histidinol-phosphatase HisJ family protein [Candidatus Babeliales bacterium]MCF7899203.1 histidinol-phosphatase HisJ family protein [Candidatus Babeliales bacterium]
MFDCHVHSNYSDDSKTKAIDHCNQAIKNNILGITFTDHYEIDYPNPKYKYEFDFNKRSQELNLLQKDFNKNLKILQGIEIGIQKHVIDDLTKISKSFDFDFILASIHCLDRQDIGNPNYYTGKDKKEFLTKYLQEIYYSAVNFSNFDVIAHIGYPRRYCNFTDNSMNYKDYTDLIDMILNKIIDLGKGIEANTSGYRYSLNGTIPSYDILERYHELKGEVLTIGSDAHTENNLGSFFEITKNNLKKIGFKYLTYFEKRKPVFYKI